MKRKSRGIVARRLASGIIVYDVRACKKYGIATLDEAEAVLLEAKRKQRLGITAPKRYTVAEVIDLRVANTVRRKSIHDTERIAEWWKAYYKGKHIDEITVENVKTAIEQIRHSGRLGTRANATVNRYLLVLRSAVNYAIRRVWMTTNPLADIPKLPETKRPIRPLTPTQEGSIATLLGPENYDIVRLGILTGFRESNLFAIHRYDDLNFEDRLITIPDTKAGTPHYEPMTDEVETILRRMMARSVSEWLIPNPKRPTEPRNGQYWYNRVFKPAMVKLGFYRSKTDGIRFHDVRKTFASRLGMLGHKEHVIMATGQWSDSTVVSRYVKIYDDNVRKALEGLSSIGPAIARIDDQNDVKTYRNVPETTQPVDIVTRRGARVAESGGLENR